MESDLGNIINIEQLKKIQIEILDVVSDFCEKNNIKYWIDSGTLLGAIRHKGYIPWDDDIDVGMLRCDYDRFLNEFNKSNSQYKAYSIENNKDFFYPYCKVLDTNTILFEPDKNGKQLNVNIDVFVFDQAPKSPIVLKWTYLKRDLYQRCILIKELYTPHDNIIEKVLVRIASVFLLPFSKYYLTMKIAKNSKKYYNSNCAYLGDFMGYSHTHLNKKIFSSCKTAIFEGKAYKIPQGYQEYLQAFYGDYLKLPPECDRVSHHKFEAYYKN